MNTRQRTLSKVVGLLVAGLLAGLAGGQPLHAQDGGWTQPELIFEANGRLDNPVIVADAYGQVHGFVVFTEEAFGTSASRSVYYSRLDDPEWQPLDIFVIGGNGTGLTGVSGGNGLALLVNGGDFADSGPSPAHTAKDWHGPTTINQAYTNPNLAVAPDGALWMAFGTSSAEINVERRDPVTGIWEAPKLVGDTASTNAAADWMKLAFSPDGTMHVVWSEFQLPNGWPPLGIYYARSTDGGQTWTDRRRIANQGFNQPNVVIGQNNEVYLTWTGIAGIAGKYFQESLDGGLTWRDIVTLLPAATGGGSEGPPYLSVDSAGGLHVIYSNQGCVWYVSRPVDKPWTDPVCISAEAVAGQIEYPTMGIRLGNELHVIFWTDRRQLWHTTLTLALPAETPLPIPERPTATPVPPTPTRTPVPTTTPLPDYGPAPTSQMVTGPGLFSIAAGAVPVLLLLGLVLIGRRRGPGQR